jgi:hypothetical protein
MELIATLWMIVRTHVAEVRVMRRRDDGYSAEMVVITAAAVIAAALLATIIYNKLTAKANSISP